MDNMRPLRPGNNNNNKENNNNNNSYGMKRFMGDNNEPNNNNNNIPNNIPNNNNNNNNLLHSTPNFIRGGGGEGMIQMNLIPSGNNNPNNNNRNLISGKIMTNSLNNFNNERRYKTNQMISGMGNNNYIGYTPLVQDMFSGGPNQLRNMGGGNQFLSGNNFNNKNRPQMENNQPISNYMPIKKSNSGFNKSGRPMSGGGGMQQSNSGFMRGGGQNNNNMGNINNGYNINTGNNPLNNFNPSLIKRKGTPQASHGLLNRGGGQKQGGPVKIKNNNSNGHLNTKKPNTPDLNHYNSTGFLVDNSGVNVNNNKYNSNNPNKIGNTNHSSTMSRGFGHTANNFNQNKMHNNMQRPSTAPQKDKQGNENIYGNNNNNRKKTNNNYINNFNSNNNKTKFNQRPSSAGGKNSGNKNNMNMGGGINPGAGRKFGASINKRLASPQMYSNPNMGINNNNSGKFNGAKYRGQSPGVKSSNFARRPPLPNRPSRMGSNKPANMHF